MRAPSILAIKLAALGDFALAFGPFAAIRAHHPTARITLLTTPPYAPLARLSPWFDEVWDDGRPAARDLGGLLRLARRLRAARFDRVYDLQTSGRSSRYRLFVGARAEWSGIARGASHPHANPIRDSMHTIERQREQLAMAGITRFPEPDLGWLDADLSRFGLPERFGVLVPGAAPSRPAKRWPVECFAALAADLPLPSVVIGSRGEAPLAAAIRAARPDALDLTGRTALTDIAAIARHAAFAVGNDTGPMHLLAACGCPGLTLFGADSDPALCAPRAGGAINLRRIPLSGLTVEEVRGAIVAAGFA